MTINEVPLPAFESNEVLIRVHATSVNPIDWKMAKGYIKVAPPFPITPCVDVAGVVVDVGKGCLKIHVGDEVFGLAKYISGRKFGGAAAEYMSVPEKCVALKPASLSFSEAAALPLVGLVAFQNLHKIIDEGSKILILGGSGGPGSFAIQLAKLTNCYVASTCSIRNFDLLQELGVDKIIDYKSQKWYEVIENEDYDVVYDCIGERDSYKNSDKVLREGGHFIAVASDDETKPSIGKFISRGVEYAGRKLFSIMGVGPKYDHISCNPNKGYKHLEEIAKLVDNGLIRPVMEKVVQFDEFAKAIDFCQSHKVRGKVCVQIVPEDTSYFRMKKYADTLDVQTPEREDTSSSLLMEDHPPKIVRMGEKDKVDERDVQMDVQMDVQRDVQMDVQREYTSSYVPEHSPDFVDRIHFREEIVKDVPAVFEKEEIPLGMDEGKEEKHVE